VEVVVDDLTVKSQRMLEFGHIMSKDALQGQEYFRVEKGGNWEG